ncbi:uncharacterized protein LOC132718220 [Ruditapes philippinarum]|uniref:uncharacterized protein LOC132718220 n=1 Tax=Ruditapes philippinarum TaxID=129788 RepID=UPI00295C0CD5|nr:uncharacterized protein LOC132718220 [Ruditapes philippinarum]
MANTRRDRQCIVEVFQHHTRRDFHISSFIEKLKKHGLINQRQYNNLHSTHDDSGYVQLIDLLCNLLTLLSYDNMCFLFEEEGYTDIASNLRTKRFTIRYRRLPQIEMPHSKRTHDYYQHIKSCIDNNSFWGDNRVILMQFMHKQDEKIMMNRDQISNHDRQFAMERKAAATVLLIQHYKDIEERKRILHQAIGTETNGVDNTSLQIVFHSKMAITEVEAGNIRKAEEHIVKTKEFCLMYRPCFAITSAFHDIEYTYKCLYFKNPSDEMLEKILVEGDIAIQSLNEESEDVQNLWRRIMLLFMVLSLLFITADFVVCDITKIKTIHKKRAKKILKEIKRCSHEIQIRRQMILNLCLAVLEEEKDIKAAEMYAKHAVNNAENGGCFREIEKQNVKAYLKSIQSKMIAQKIRTCFMLVSIIIGICFGIHYFMVYFTTDDKCIVFLIYCSTTTICVVLGNYFSQVLPFSFMSRD